MYSDKIAVPPGGGGIRKTMTVHSLPKTLKYTGVMEVHVINLITKRTL
jgi:hypothetical protein